jgi:hypothetical protein
MSELLMMEAALFQLRAALGDDPSLLPVRLSADVLANAVSEAKAGGLNAARVNDIAFALNDLVTAVDDAGAPEGVSVIVAMLQKDAAALQAAVALPQELVASLHEFRGMLRERAVAMERGQYRVEGAAEVELPHPPARLREVAIPIARQLEAVGFVTPSLASLIENQGELRYHTLNEVVDELDVILAT